MEWLILPSLKKEKNTKKPELPKAPSTWGTQTFWHSWKTDTISKLFETQKAHWKLLLLCMCMFTVNWNCKDRKMLREEDAYKGKKRKNKEILYTQKQVQPEKGCHALPEIEVTLLKNNALSFCSLKWDVRRKDLEALSSIVLYEAKNHSPKLHVIWDACSVYGAVGKVSRLALGTSWLCVALESRKAYREVKMAKFSLYCFTIQPSRVNLPPAFSCNLHVIARFPSLSHAFPLLFLDT